MARQFNYPQSWSPITGVTLAGIVLATLFCQFDGTTAEGCSVLEKALWVALRELSPAVLEGWRTVSAYVCQDAGLWQHVLQFVMSLWPLLCIFAGQA